MPNPLYNSMMQNHGQGNMMSEFAAFRQNPVGYLMQKKINIPQEYMNNPRDAVQYLLNSGKMSQDQFSRLSQMAQQMGIRF